MTSDSLPIAPREVAILAALENGCTRTAAAAFAGITRVTLWRMVERDEAFRNAVERAEGIAEARAVHIVTQAAENGKWEAAAWWLERRRPAEYGRRVALDVSIRDEAVRLAAELGLDADSIISEAERILTRDGTQ